MVKEEAHVSAVSGDGVQSSTRDRVFTMNT